MSLTMKEVDQETGEDLNPNSTGKIIIKLSFLLNLT